MSEPTKKVGAWAPTKDPPLHTCILFLQSRPWMDNDNFPVKQASIELHINMLPTQLPPFLGEWSVPILCKLKSLDRASQNSIYILNISSYMLPTQLPPFLGVCSVPIFT